MPIDLNEYDDLIRKEPPKTVPDGVGASVYTAAGSNPEEEAQLRDISKKVGIPIEALRDKGIRDEAKRKDVATAAANASPATAEWLANPDNAALAHDDIAALSRKEEVASTLGSLKTFFGKDIPNLATSYGARMGAQVEQGVGGLLQFIGERADQNTNAGKNVFKAGVKYDHVTLEPTYDSILKNVGADMASEGRAIADTVNEDKPLTTRGGRILGGVTDSVGAMLPGMAAGVATLNPGVGLGVMGLTTAGQSFGEKRAKGKPFDVALESGLWQGSTEVLTEALPFMKLAKWFKPGKLGRKVAEYIMADTAGEMVATALQNSGDVYFDETDPAKKKEAVLDYLSSHEFVQDEVDTVLTTVAQGFLMAAPVAAGRMGSNAYEKHRVNQLEKNLNLALSAEDSKLAARSPEVFGQAVQKMMDAHDSGTIYLQADAMMAKLHEQGLSTAEAVAWAEDKGIDRDVLDTALTTGSAVEIKAGVIAEKMASDPHLALFQKDFTTAPGDASTSTVDAMVATDSEATAHIEALAKEQDAGDKKVRGEEAEALVRRISDELVAAGQPKEYGNQFANLVLARANLLAQLTGTDAVEHLNRLGISVTRQNLADFMTARTPEAQVDRVKKDYRGRTNEGGLSLLDRLSQMGKIKLDKTGAGGMSFSEINGNESGLAAYFTTKDKIKRGAKTGITKGGQEVVGTSSVGWDVALRTLHDEGYFGGTALADLSLSDLTDLIQRDQLAKKEGTARIRANGPNDYEVALDAASRGQYFGGTNVLMQAEGADPKGALTPENLIVLFEKANLSTALHELGHVFLKDLQYVAENYGVQKIEWEAAKEWLGVDGEITREQHEKFARHFEAYLREGTAPSNTMRKAFIAFKKWMTRVYRAVEDLAAAGGIEINMTPEVRELFDLLLASVDDIIEARVTDAQVAMIDKATLAESATPEEAAEYRAVVGEAEDAAVEKMDAHKLKGREDRLREWKAQAEDTVAHEPLRVALDALSRNEAGEFGKGVGINRESIRKFIGDEGMKKLPAHPALWRTEGLDVEHAAAQAGYEDARQFIDAIVKAGTKESAVQKLVDSLEAAHDADLATEEAIRTAASRKQMEIESRIMAKIASNGPRYTKAEMRERWAVAEERLKTAIAEGKKQAEIDALKKEIADQKKADREAFNAGEAALKAIPQATLKAWAEQKIAGEKLSDAIHVHKLLVASRQLRKEAMAAAKKKDWAAAFKANEKARINEALIAQHYKAADAYRKMKAAWSRAVKTEIPVMWRDRVNQLLTQFYMTARDLPMSDGLTALGQFFAERSAGEEEDGIESLRSFMPAEFILSGGARPIQSLTWGQVQDVHDALTWLVGNGRLEKEGARTSKGMLVAEAVRLANEASGGLPVMAPIKETALFVGPRKWLRKYLAELSRLSRLMKWRDKFQENGANSSLVIDPIMEGLGDKFREGERITALQKPHLDHLIASMASGPEEYTHVPVPESMLRLGQVWNFERIVMFAMNMGTVGNYKNLLAGYGLTEADAENLVSVLSESDWRAIEGLWRATATLWPRLKAINEKIKFVPLRKVPTRTFNIKTASGDVITIEGGYHPLKYDADQDRAIAGREERTDILASHGMANQAPKAKSGMLMGRVEGVVKPVHLSMYVLAKHIEDSITLIHMALPILDADAITRHPEYMRFSEDVMGKHNADQIRPALVDILRRDGRKMDAIEQNVATLKRLASLAAIGHNIWSALQNVTNIFPVVRMTRRKAFIDGATDYYSDPVGMSKKIKSLSSYMAERDNSQEREMRRKMKKFKPTFDIKGITLEDVQNSGFALLRLTDTMLSDPMWLGSYNEGLVKFGGDEKKAIAHANKRVQTVFGSGMTIDQSALQRSPGYAGLITSLAGWFMTQQQIIANDWQAMRAGVDSKATFAYNHAMVVLFPSIASSFLLSMFTKLEPPDLDDILSDLLFAYVAGLPGIRDLIAIRALFGKGRAEGVRFPALDVAKDVQKTIVHVKNLEGEKLLWDVFKLASYASGVPAAQVYQRYLRGKDQPLPQNVLIPARP